MATNISVIIPVYNVEKYLRQCIDSVLSQTFQDFEIILVDDGSTDSSGKICDEYANKDNRIRVVHKPNGGLVSARKVGFEVSSGEYISNIDSDDWLEPNHLQVLYEGIKKENADISFADFFRNENERQVYINNIPTSIEPRQIILDFFNGKIHAGLWNKLYRRALFEENKISYPKYDYFEDMHTSISLMMYANEVAYIPVATYHYRYNSFSLTHNKDIVARIKSYEEFVLNMLDIKDKFKIDSNSEIGQAIRYCVNLHKRLLIRKYFNHKTYIKGALQYYKSSFNLRDVRTIGDFVFYMASRWKYLYPYKIKNKYRLGNQ